MDMFFEKIVRRKKSALDIAFSLFIVIIALIVSYFALIYLATFSPIFIAGIFYLAYFLASKRNVEYEYIVTNGDIDIDMIINQRKRKRVFSANCKDFEVVARVKSDQYTQHIQGIKTVLDFSSRHPNADVWFIFFTQNGTQTVVLFEPNEKMVDCFRVFIPRKVFK